MKTCCRRTSGLLYVRRQSYDYNGNVVTKGLPDPFVESLTHDSIIVQIPRLHGQINNKLDRVLSIFDQTHKDGHVKQMLNIDESAYVGDNDMLHILQRLMTAAADAKMRHEMNVEDEFFSVIEDRDTTILLRDRKIAEQNTQIAEQNTQIAEQNTQIAEQNTQIAEQNTQIAEQWATICTSVRMLHQAGMSVESIAMNLNLTTEQVRQIITEETK